MLKMFVVYDSKAASFATPFFQTNTAIALRGFAAACNNPSLDLCNFAEDFTLFELGEFDETLGTFDLHQPMQNVAMAAQFKTIKE